MIAAQREHAFENGRDRRLQFHRLGRRLHLQRHPHEQRIIEITPQPRERLAQRRLRDVKRLRRPRQAVFPQQHVEHQQVVQVELIMIARNSSHIVSFIV